jgi:hypothetical protein
MPSTPKQIFNEVLAILRADATLASYVDAIYERERDNVDEGKRVVLMVEPSEVWELDPDDPYEEIFVITIIGWIVEPDPDKAINDGSRAQILDLEHDVKYALSGYAGLNGTCNNFVFYTSKFDRRRRAYGTGASLRQPPMYGVEIYMEIFYVPDL